MAAGDIKGEEAVVIPVTSGAAIAKGQLIHLEADGKWDPVADADTGKFAVAIGPASAADETIDAVFWGRVEVTATDSAIDKGALAMAGASGKIAAADFVANAEVAGTVMEAIPSGGTGTLWVGLAR
jgi:hypothetical protein